MTQESSPDTGLKLTYFSKRPLECPVCRTEFFREDLLSGRGRLIAGRLTLELRRLYEPSKKYGVVYPLVYPVTVCPSCFYAAYPEDFLEIPAEALVPLEASTDARRELLLSIFPDLSFSAPRRLYEGVASYVLAMLCYEHFPADLAPTFKMGLSALRGAWLASDLQAQFPDEGWGLLVRHLYRKARFLYILAVEREQKGEEVLSRLKYQGPDLDKNYGYDGVLYLAGLLDYRYGPRSNREKRVASLMRAKQIIARIFGMGRASKHKPQVLLDNARDVYDLIREELESLGADGGEPVDGSA
ncbi:Protein of unknown function DUF2225 [Spirochaeta thermophila DSM 6578]|uniref:DUF2225 domain-containing protein n=1 Tax=Winmispira thermophila (strain ATCC 700085 / DSM 6578 / Z-1203) TaxID=869211 RepID=G0GD59_WINT7|nr:DUF2225 domain-containing protein [Spirochaeta thermophila]AEJ62134.1 Protein of unknown function DUF2225 [Spirochaeta thermophila DSM 6578]